MSFWKNIGAVLEFRRMNQKRWRKKTNSMSRILKIKTGSVPSANITICIAGIRNVSAEYLVTGETEMKISTGSSHRFRLSQKRQKKSSL